MRSRWITVTVLAAAVIAGCGTAPPAAAPPTSKLPPAAEPAPAPVPTAPPAGRTVPVGAAPEGVVVDPQTHIVAVGVRDPAALTLVDANTGAVLRTVPLPGALRHLQLAGPGGPVLVPDEGSNRLLRVALPGGEITSQVVTGVVPHDATQAADGTVFVANELGHSVVAVRGDQVVHTFTDVTQPAGLAAVGNLVGLVDVRENTLTIYDAQRLQRVAELPAGAGPTHVVADKRGHLAVIDTRGGAVLLYELQPTIRQIGRVELPGTPYGVAYDPVRDRLWVTLTALNEVIGLNLNASAPVLATPLPTVRQPNTVAVDSATGRLFVTGTDEGVLEIIEP
ncbi:MAG: YncE family protein [Pseudonocardiaceae bacterium]|nr:YncE family protein [Pseudonocardiaceae bacterium]